MLHLVAKTLEIEGKLTTHIARHSFATQAGDIVSIQMLQKLYMHNDVRMTIGYQATFINQEANKALLSVVG